MGCSIIGNRVRGCGVCWMVRSVSQIGGIQAGKCWLFHRFERLSWLADSLRILFALGSTSNLDAGCYISYKTKRLSSGIRTWTSRLLWQHNSKFPPLFCLPLTSASSRAFHLLSMPTNPIKLWTHFALTPILFLPIKTILVFLNYPPLVDRWQV